ncbi:heavy metal sensor histidine kinase [Aquabacterium sp.]|uniref:heavy metal sensor histidine kinase n=1 Tax=Aquabacterium sp. TaxID=1872578 RepID=UPI002CF25F81|nr:heavy metal sensor histidine kinase [Aquabacterium sp.]HSW07247.1 heavy metal sensor histidine kinase [Aquabacterium sp.]
MPATTELPAGLSEHCPRALRFCLRRLKRSLTAQISLSIAMISILLVAGSGLMIIRMAARELIEDKELFMLANLALLREDLGAARFDLTQEPQRLVRRMDLQLGNLHMAMYDEHRQVIAASEHFEVPAARLPAHAILADHLPLGIQQSDVRALAQALGPLTTVWDAPDGHSFRVLLARIPVPPDSLAAGRTRSLLVAFAYDLTQNRKLMAAEFRIFGFTLLAGALAAALMGVWIARRILAGPRHLAAVANRISVRPLHERLQVANSPTELRESAEAFNRMLDRLDSAFKRLSEFSSDLAHDLRTPINNLLGEAQVALSKPRSAAEYRAVLESAVEDYERISRLIENMLFLARADDPQAAIRPLWIDLQPWLERGCGYFEMLAEECGVTLAMQMAGVGAMWQQVWADETLLTRALGNLVSNALRYAPRGSQITVGSQLHEGGTCTLTVCNDGPPIAPEHQQRIFDRSFRVDPSRAGSASGSGLGLAIVKSIMDLHGGTVTVASAPGQPTVFSLWFPGPAALVT